MALDSGAIADALVDVLQGLTGIGPVQLGVPKSFTERIHAFVTMAGKLMGRKNSGTSYVDHRFFVCFCYRVGDAESTAETTLMGLVDQFLQALHDDLTLGGTCEGLEIEVTAPDEPEYRPYAGREYRDYPLTISARQYGSYATNP